MPRQALQPHRREAEQGPAVLLATDTVH
jgi:hypothetical protein